MTKIYYAIIKSKHMGYTRQSNNPKSLEQSINQEFGKGWKVTIFECNNENECRLAHHYHEGKVVRDYWTRN